MKDIREKVTLDRNCKYSMVMAVANRAKELRREAREKNVSHEEIDSTKSPFAKPLTIAYEEFISRKIGLKFKVPLADLEKEKNS